jgi:CRP-like cAMP-binding protein
MDKVAIEKALGECTFFNGLQPDDISKVASLCRVKAYNIGDFVFRQGEPGDSLFIIVEGQVYLERAADLGARKGTVVIDILGKGRFLGSWSTILGEPHILMSSACCQTPAVIVTFEGSQLRELMQANGEFGFNILERLCFLLRERIQAAYGALEKI